MVYFDLLEQFDRDGCDHEALDEATPIDIKRKQKSINKLFPQFPERVKAIQDKGGLRLKKVDQETWHWKIHSGTKKDVWYDAVVHFKGVEPLLRKLVADRRLWNKDRTKVNLNKLSREFMKRADIQLGCSCAAQKYWGGDYILSKPKYDAKYGDKEDRAPNIRNPKQYGAHCFDERAMVLMGDGTYKSIRDVQVGDMVVTHTGKVVPVIETMWSWSDDLYEMKVGGFGGQFSVTGNHEFYVKDRNRQCLCGCGRELKLNSTYQEKGRQAIFDRKYVSGHCKREQQLDDVSDQMQWLPIEDLDVSTLFYCPVPVFGEEIFVDSMLARLLGYYLAEGSMCYYYEEGDSDRHFVNGVGKSAKATGVNFTLNANERNTLGADIERLCEVCFSKSASVVERTIRETDSYLSVSVHGPELVIPFLEWVGVGGKEKCLSPHLLSMNREARIQFVLGACLGDGHVDRGRMIYVTANETIAQQMHSMVTSLGIRASLSQYKSSCQNGFEGVRYYVEFMLYDAPEEMIKVLMDFGKCDMYPIRSENRNRDYLYGHGGMFRVVRELRLLNKRCMVYNLEVGDEDHSYIVNGIAVHNCKHLQNLFKALPFYADTMAKWLNDFYPQLIGEVEKESGEEADKFKRAGEELRKRKVTKEKPVRKPVRPAKAKEEPRAAEPRKEPEKEPEREEEPQKEEPERKVEPEKEEPEREEEPQKEEERPAKAQEPEEEDIPDQMEEPEGEEPEEDEDDDKENRKIWTV